MYSILYRYSLLLFLGCMAFVGCGQGDIEEPSNDPEKAQDSTPAWEPVDPDYVDEDD